MNKRKLQIIFYSHVPISSHRKKGLKTVVSQCNRGVRKENVVLSNSYTEAVITVKVLPPAVQTINLCIRVKKI